MDCPRCDGELDSYSLGGHQATVCEDCGWTGIEGRLGDSGEAEPSESWTDAIGRVTERRVTTVKSPSELPPFIADEETTQSSENDSETGSDSSTDPDSTANAASTDSVERDEPAPEDVEPEEEDRPGREPAVDRGGDGFDDSEPVHVIENLDSADAERLRAVGVHTVDDLATVDPMEITDRTDIPGLRIRGYVRQAAVRLVTDEPD
ncbi:MAG: hypothetical protein ABEH56_04705 [Salinirussus sp.]